MTFRNSQVPLSAAGIANLEAVSVANIDNPTELNSLAGTVVGERRVCYQVVGGDNVYTTYYWDSADSSGASTPYVMAGSSGFWIACAGRNINPSIQVRGSITSASTVQGTQLISTVATGTAPLTVSSTTVVGNLNVSQLLGGTWAVPGSIGATTPNAGAFTTLSASGTSTLAAVNASSTITCTFAGFGSGDGDIVAAVQTAGGNAGYRFKTGGVDRWGISLVGAAGSEAMRWRNIAAGTTPMQLAYDGTWSLSATAVTHSIAGGIASTSPTRGIGYATGAGGTVTQATSKSTGVTLNTVCGTITLNGAALAADTTVSFTMTNSAIAATDVVAVVHDSVGTLGAYTFAVTPAAGSASIAVHNCTPGSLSEAIVLRFAVIKAVTA